MSEVPASRFPAGFLWGVTTAAYQTEGAVDEDGRGESTWDRFCATPGKVRNGDSGAIACDSYHRCDEDLELMRALGVTAHRFSVSWSRVLPGGRGPVNAQGLDFYDRQVDRLLAAGIAPFVTLNHWDMPQALEDRGGWKARATVAAFAEYAEAVVERLGDRAVHWITHCEPWVVAWLGYGMGVHAPGGRSESDALAAGHHLLVAHGRVVEMLRSTVPHAQVGVSLNLEPVWPASTTEQDRAAARWWDGHHNRWFLEPLYHGSYPQDMVDVWQGIMPPVEDGDMALIATPTDFLSVSYYTGVTVAGGSDDERARPVPQPHIARTDMGWEIRPDGFTEMLVTVARDYAPAAIYVTENGAAFPDVVGHDGNIADPERRDFLEAHVRAAFAALEAQVPLRGYFVWSLLDNFEWSWGYWKRFGLVHVDYPTQKRTPKASFYWYRDLIASERAGNVGSAA